MKWSGAEKRLAREAFDAALAAELAEVLADFKARASAAMAADDIWRIVEDMERKRREIDGKYDYRYAQLPWVFGRLLREGRVQEAQLAGLSAEKLAIIRRIASR
jgi:hypothetical protein